MPCSGLKSATSFTSGARCSRSIVVAPSRARPVWFVTRPTRLPLSAAKPFARNTSMPVRTGAARPRRRQGAAGAKIATGQHKLTARRHRGGQRRGRHRRDACAQRCHVALAVWVDAVREEDHVEAGRGIRPQRRPGEARVAERAERAGVRRGWTKTTSPCPSRAIARCAPRQASPPSSFSRPRAATGCARRGRRRRRAACARRLRDRRPSRRGQHVPRRRPCGAPSDRARYPAASSCPAPRTASRTACRARSERSAR